MTLHKLTEHIRVFLTSIRMILIFQFQIILQ